MTACLGKSLTVRVFCESLSVLACASFHFGFEWGGRGVRDLI